MRLRRWVVIGTSGDLEFAREYFFFYVSAAGYAQHMRNDSDLWTVEVLQAKDAPPPPPAGALLQFIEARRRPRRHSHWWVLAAVPLGTAWALVATYIASNIVGWTALTLIGSGLLGFALGSWMSTPIEN